MHFLYCTRLQHFKLLVKTLNLPQCQVLNCKLSKLYSFKQITQLQCTDLYGLNLIFFCHASFHKEWQFSLTKFKLSLVCALVIHWTLSTNGEVVLPTKLIAIRIWTNIVYNGQYSQKLDKIRLLWRKPRWHYINLFFTNFGCTRSILFQCSMELFMQYFSGEVKCYYSSSLAAIL